MTAEKADPQTAGSDRAQHRSMEVKQLTGREGTEKIHNLVKEIRIAMMSTLDANGQIYSRPMATQDAPFDGTVWFLTRSDSAKVHEIQQNQAVTLDYADPAHSKYITLRGHASVSLDRNKIHELWNPIYKAWFPEGENDPTIAVVRVEVSDGDFWEADSNKIILGIRYAAAAITGGAVPVGTSGHVDVA